MLLFISPNETKKNLKTNSNSLSLSHPDPAGASSLSITLADDRKLSADSSEPSHPEQGNSTLAALLEDEEPSPSSEAEAEEANDEGGSTQTFSRNQAVPKSHAEGSTCATLTRFSLPIGWRTRRA